MSTTPQKVLLVIEEDQELREAITALLRKQGYCVLALANGAMALRVAVDNVISLILLDPVKLQPGGPELCRQLQALTQTASIPILLMVTKESEIAYFEKLQLGVSDYITKPLDWRELLACVQALMRSGKRTPKPKAVATLPLRKQPVEEHEALLNAGGLSIDRVQRKVFLHSKPIELRKPLLFDLLVYLVQHRSLVLSREQLLADVWGYPSFHTTRTVDVHMRWLRELLGENPDHPQCIETIHGVGYRFQER